MHEPADKTDAQRAIEYLRRRIDEQEQLAAHAEPEKAGLHRELIDEFQQRLDNLQGRLREAQAVED